RSLAQRAARAARRRRAAGARSQRMHGEVGARETERVGGTMTRLGGWTVWRLGAALACVLTAKPSNRLTAQDTTHVRDTTHIVLPADTMHHGVRPMGAFLRSFVFPGWGQAATGRPMTGSVFVAWEGVTAMMTLKAEQEANYFKEIHSKNLRLKRQEVQDWLV